MHRFGLVLALLASGCITRTATGDDAQVDPIDANVLDVFVVDEPDVGARDARIIDAGPPPDLGRRDDPPLARALSCDMNADDALRATVRWVACAPDDERSTVTGLMEGWAAGLFGTGDPSARQFSSQMTGLGCDRWRCLSTARTCAAARDCRSGPPREPNPAPDPECQPGASDCVGDVVMTCEDDMLRQTLDCTLLNLPCQHAPGSGRTFCSSDACQTVLGVNELVCDGNRLTACEGTLGVDCGDWRPGSICQSFAIGGEVPINFCGPVGFGGAGAYATPVECADDGVITFTALQVDEYRFDCRGAGYSGCDARGCLE